MGRACDVLVDKWCVHAIVWGQMVRTCVGVKDDSDVAKMLFFILKPLVKIYYNFVL